MVLSREDLARADALANEGRSVRYIAQVIGEPRSTIHDGLQRLRTTGSLDRREGSGRQRCTSPRDDRFITLTVLRNRHVTAPEIRSELQTVRNVRVSSRTVIRRLQKNNLVSRRLASGPLLLERHRVERRLFVNQYLHWTLEQWGAVLFTDECRFALWQSDDRDRVWRRPGERYASCTMRESQPFQRQPIMV